MKIFGILLLISLSINSHAQIIKPSIKKWNGKEVLKRTNDSTAYFIDFQKMKSRADLATIIPSDIATVTAYFEDEPDLPIIFKDYIQNGAISLITKKYAISQYRPALSKLSKDYLEMTKSQSPDADSLFYVIDNENLTPNIEGKLLNLDYSKIKSIKILLPGEAEKIYGDKAKFGAVIISSNSE